MTRLALAVVLVLAAASAAVAQWLPIGLGRPPASAPFVSATRGLSLVSGNNTVLVSGNNLAW